MANLVTSKPSTNVKPSSPGFHVVFSSAYFRLYVESGANSWSLVRHQTIDQIRPVLLFKSTGDAEAYATQVLGLSPSNRYVPPKVPWYWIDTSRSQLFEVYSDDTQAPMLTKVYEPDPLMRLPDHVHSGVAPSEGSRSRPLTVGSE